MNIAQNCCTLLHFLSRYVIRKRLRCLFVTNFAKLRRYDAIIYHHLEAHVSFSVSVQTVIKEVSLKMVLNTIHPISFIMDRKDTKLLFSFYLSGNDLDNIIFVIA